MKRILFITHTISSGGGAERVLNTLINELASDYEIDVLEWLEDTASPFMSVKENVHRIGSIALSDRKASQLKRNVKFNQIKHFYWALINLFFPKFLYKKYIKRKYDYEISFNYLYTSALVTSSNNLSSKKIMWMHGAINDLNDRVNYRGIKYQLYRWMQTRALQKTNTIVTISKETHRSVELFCPSIKNKIIDIYNGYDFKQIIDQAHKISIEKSKYYRLVTLGRLSRAKNILLQLEAIEYLRLNNIIVELLVLGEGEQESEVREYAKKNPSVKIYGFQTNPYPYLLSADALIITSYAEGFPTIAVEAMVLGKPVISTPVAGTDELITPSTGLLVDWDVKSVADGIKKVMTTKYDANILKNHIGRYTKENWANNVKILLERLDNE